MRVKNVIIRQMSYLSNYFIFKYFKMYTLIIVPYELSAQQVELHLPKYTVNFYLYHIFMSNNCIKHELQK